MTPPEAPESDPGNMPPAVFACPGPSKCPEVLKTRADFLATARARYQSTPSMVVQARNRKDDSAAIRMGFTCSKKVGNAVARNRAKRRLREAARLILPTPGLPGWDYVLIGRAGATAARPFDHLKEDLVQALAKLHSER